MSDRAAYARPEASEYAEAYAGYVAEAPAGELLVVLERQGSETQALIAGLSEQEANAAYAPGKWTLKEVLGHLADAERVFAYRALCFARGDRNPLASFDESAWAPNSAARDCELHELAEGLRAVRAATLALLRQLPVAASLRRGTVNGKEITVRALGWIIAGHERHHLTIIRERYLTRGGGSR